MRANHPRQWEGIAGYLGDRIKPLVVEQLIRELELKGTLRVLRHGIRFHGKTWQIAHFQPAHGLNPNAVAKFALNELTVTRAGSLSSRQGSHS